MIYIVRHGQTQKNRENLLQGRSDVPLNEEGKKQAAAAAKWFEEQGIRIDVAYTSPLSRAVETARIIVPSISSQTDERLIEMDYGPYEGMDLMNPAPEVMTFFSDFAHNPVPEGMEPLNAVTARLREFLEEIRNIAANQNILISTHAIAMKGALEYLTPSSGGSYWSKYIGNCAVYAAGVENGVYTIPYEAWNLQKA